MEAKRLGGLVLVAVGAAALIFGARALLRQRPTDEELLAQLLEQMAEAAERGDAKELRGHLSRRYRDDTGRDYQAISSVVTLHLLRPGRVSVYTLRRQVELDRSAARPVARAKVVVVLTRGPKLKKLPDVLPHSARALVINLTLEEEEEEEWRVVSARWSRAQNLRDLVR
jgi:hypothetical protein